MYRGPVVEIAQHSRGETESRRSCSCLLRRSAVCRHLWMFVGHYIVYAPWVLKNLFEGDFFFHKKLFLLCVQCSCFVNRKLECGLVVSHRPRTSHSTYLYKSAPRRLAELPCNVSFVVSCNLLFYPVRRGGANRVG